MPVDRYVGLLAGSRPDFIATRAGSKLLLCVSRACSVNLELAVDAVNVDSLKKVTVWTWLSG